MGGRHRRADGHGPARVAQLRTRLPPWIFASAPDDAQAAVEIMALGAAGQLVLAQVPPSQLLPMLNSQVPNARRA
jgi:hypothetical protein